jgi:DNA modification methylase
VDSEGEPLGEPSSSTAPGPGPGPQRAAGAAYSRPSPAQRKRATSTSSFGVSRRENHDASGFYARFTAPILSADDTIEPPGVVDQIYVGDARQMDRVRPASVALVVTSPPYFAGKAYEEELGEGHIPATYVEYLTMLEDVFAECVAKLEPGGRIAVNVANLGRKPYRSLSADVIGILQDRLGLLLRGEVVWRKARGAGGNCAWGSFKKPANPVLRDLTERVVIASKGRFDRAVGAAKRAQLDLPSVATTTADEFMEATLDVWELAPESATRVGHPAPFPVELPQRLIDLYTYRGDVVLDPFMGSGTTAVAAVRSGRHYLGYDTDEGYAKAARERVAGDAEAVLASPAVDRPDKAAGAARAHLEAAGFTVEDAKVTKRRRFAGGLTVDWVATDRAGAEWLVLVAGASTIVRSGLRRSDVLFRTLGEATVLTNAGHRVVVVTTDLPSPRSAPLAALRDARGVSLVDVVELGAPGTTDRLATYAAGGVAAPVGELLPGR